jgi:predicted GIY-YIG superfamily endonuclease
MTEHQTSNFWIYVLDCEDGRKYVGQTSRLNARLKEHVFGEGAHYTRLFKPVRITAIYRSKDNTSYVNFRESVRNNEYNPLILYKWNEGYADNNLIEQNITELMMYHQIRDGRYDAKIRGGKYCRVEMSGIPPGINVDRINDRPECHCGLPAEVKLRNKRQIQFVCPRQNFSEWNFVDYGDIPLTTPCRFSQFYTDDEKLRDRYNNELRHKFNETWTDLLPIRVAGEKCRGCHKENYLAAFCHAKPRAICQHCFYKHMDVIEKTGVLPSPVNELDIQDDLITIPVADPQTEHVSQQQSLTPAPAPSPSINPAKINLIIDTIAECIKKIVNIILDTPVVTV